MIVIFTSQHELAHLFTTNDDDMKRKTTKKVTVLHTQVLRAVNAIPVRVASQRDSMIHVLAILAHEQNTVPGAVPGAYIEIPQSYWKKVSGAHYERPLNRLKAYGVVQSLDSYSNFEGNVYCKSYRINPDLIDDQVKSVVYNVSDKGEDSHLKDNSAVAKYTRRILREVNLNVRAAKEETRSYVKHRKFVSKLQIDNEIPGNWIDKFDSTNVPHWRENFTKGTVGMLIEKANRYGCSLIKDKNRYIIDTVKSYLNRKAKHITQSYVYSIAQIQHRDIYAKRNSTNKRLDSNITAFPTMLLGHISIDGQSLVSIDLSNSQMVILANIIEQNHLNFNSTTNVTITLDDLIFQGFISLTTIPDTSSNTQYYSFTRPNQWNTQHQTIPGALTFMCAKPETKEASEGEENTLIWHNMESFPADLRLFLELTKTGKIYDFIKDKLNMSTRAAAKTLAFEIFFAKHRYHGYAKRQLKIIFPTLIKIIDDYKKAKGDNQLAIMLQERESAIFIDRIMPRLMTKGYKVLSKHDSILCLAVDVTEVEREMRIVLDEELGQYELKITQADGKPLHATPKNSLLIPPSAYEDSKRPSVENSLPGKPILPNQIRKRQQ